MEVRGLNGTLKQAMVSCFLLFALLLVRLCSHMLNISNLRMHKSPNKSFVRDCQNASFVLKVRCTADLAPQLKRYV